MNPETLHIKEEQEEILTTHEEQQSSGLEEADIIKVIITAVPVKTEDDEEKPQFLPFHQSQAEDNRDTEPESDGPEPSSDPDLQSEFKPDADEKASDYSETTDESGPENEDSDGGWKEGRALESDLNMDVDCNAAKKILKLHFVGSAVYLQAVSSETADMPFRTNSFQLFG